MEYPPCPHCGTKDPYPWFDRSITIDGLGNELPWETCAMRCSSCGKNLEAPRSYYEGED
jgi:phage terminase large subunit GpA-like protein